MFNKKIENYWIQSQRLKFNRMQTKNLIWKINADESVGQIRPWIFHARSVRKQRRDFFPRACRRAVKEAHGRTLREMREQAKLVTIMMATDTAAAAASRKKCSLTRSRPFSERRTIRRKTMPASTPPSAILLPSSCPGWLSGGRERIFYHTALFLPVCWIVFRASCLST